MREARDEMAWIACLMVGDVLPRQRQCADKTPCEACYERGDAILAALSSAGIDCEGWRDIKSAPKDGTEFIALHKPPYGASGNQVIAYWHNYQNDPCFVAAGTGHIVLESVYTHWRPLPLPPLASGGG